MERLTSYTFQFHNGQDIYGTWCQESITAKTEEEHHHHHHHLFTDSIMKTLYFSLGLLLLTACCCTAMPKALQFTSIAPGNCCFNVYTRSLPLKRVSSITKSHSSCLKQAFIVQTVKGRQICYSGTFQWALDVYNQLHNTEGSSQQH